MCECWSVSSGDGWKEHKVWKECHGDETQSASRECLRLDGNLGSESNILAVRRSVSTQSSGLCSSRETRWVPSTKAESNHAPKRGRWEGFVRLFDMKDADQFAQFTIRMGRSRRAPENMLIRPVIF